MPTTIPSDQINLQLKTYDTQSNTSRPLSTCYSMLCKTLVLLVVGYVSSLTAESRRSTLRPWGAGPELGWFQETRNAKDGLLEVCVKWEEGTTEDANENEKQQALSLLLPDRGKGSDLSSTLWPSAIAASVLLRSPEFRSLAEGKDILELGSGLGLAGLVAAENSAMCILTDNDEETVASYEKTIAWNKNELKADLVGKRMEWRDDHDKPNPVDIVLGADIAYYFYLLRPIMDTTRAYLTKKDPLVMFVGQANRESQWDLYNNIRKGCYNQLTDEHEPAWPGHTKMLLYNLEISDWVEDPTDCQSNINGVVPIAVLLHYSDGVDLPSFSASDHVATDEDDKKIMKNF
jgi:predicted nicotinamide N-methyase